MNHSSPSMTFQSLFDIALQDYEKQTGLKLIDHLHAEGLEQCNSVEAITTFSKTVYSEERMEIS
jgi:hypothetical protein